MTRDRSPPIRQSDDIIIEEDPKELEERKKEELLLLERLKNQKNKEVTDNDEREKLESEKFTMLSSRPAGVKPEAEVVCEGKEKPTERCPFCSEKSMDEESLLQHMKISHRKEMFGCSCCKAVQLQVIGWSVEVLLQHLATSHELNVSISEAISSYVAIPESLHKITCKLCPPPHILGSEGFWVGGDVPDHMSSVAMHFEQVHLMTEKNHVLAKLELACRGCDSIFPYSERQEWLSHMKRNHARLNRPSNLAKRTGPRKRCDFCMEDVVQSEAVRHIKEAHYQETFQCKLCLTADPTSFPYTETIKEMTGHMVLKHGDQVDSYYDHMVYPLTLYGSLCSGKDCSVTGKVLAFDAAAIGKHLRQHREDGESEVGEFYCRCCDRVKERFQSIPEVEAHIEKRHKQILKWRLTNGNL